MAKLSNDELIVALREVALIELSDFIELFRETLDVEAAAPVAVAIATPAADIPATEEKDEFEATLKSADGKKIAVVRVVKNLAGLGLKEAKDLVDSAPLTIFLATGREDAEKVKTGIEEVGDKVALK